MFDLRTSANDPDVRYGGYAVPLTISSSTAPMFAQRSAGRSVSGFSWVSLVTAGGSDQLKAETPDMIGDISPSHLRFLS